MEKVLSMADSIVQSAGCCDAGRDIWEDKNMKQFLEKGQSN